MNRIHGLYKPLYARFATQFSAKYKPSPVSGAVVGVIIQLRREVALDYLETKTGRGIRVFRLLLP